MPERVRVPAFTVIAEGDPHPVDSDWDSFLTWTRVPGPSSWAHGSNVDRGRYRELARGAGFSEEDLDRLLAEDGHGTVREGAHGAALMLQIPTVPDAGFPEVRWDRVLAVVTDASLLTAIDGSLELQNIVALHGTRASNMSFRARLLLPSLYWHVIGTSTSSRDSTKRPVVWRRWRKETTSARDVPASTGDRGGGRRPPAAQGCPARARRRQDESPWGPPKDETDIADLAQDTESLYATIEHMKEELKSLIELHINLKSFEMNKFLKLLAVATFLGLIPTVVGGLLGMNVAGKPWAVTLGQYHVRRHHGDGHIHIYVCHEGLVEVTETDGERRVSRRRGRGDVGGDAARSLRKAVPQRLCASLTSKKIYANLTHVSLDCGRFDDAPTRCPSASH